MVDSQSLNLNENRAMIREATLSDIPNLIERGHDFAASLPYPIVSDSESIGETLEKLIASPDAVVFVNEEATAGIAGLTYPFFFGKDTKTSQELFWWVDEDIRGGGIGMELFNAFEQWSKDQGVDVITMVCLEDKNKDMISGLYLHKGYIPTESSYARVL